MSDVVLRGTCQQCVFSRRMTQLGALGLFCCHNPPTIQITQTSPTSANMSGVFPPVTESGWCGRFEPDGMSRQ